MLYLHRQREAKVTETAAAVRVEVPIWSVVARTLLRKRRVTRPRTPDDHRIMRMQLTPRGNAGREDQKTVGRPVTRKAMGVAKEREKIIRWFSCWHLRYAIDLTVLGSPSLL